MNKVILSGRPTKDPDIRYSQSADGSMAIARLTLAVNRRFAKESVAQKADFISCVAFARQAEFIEKYIHQGTKINVIGRIQTGSYTNKDGQKVYTTDVVLEDVEFCESKSSAENHSQNNTNSSTTASDGFMNIPDGVEDEGLPFN